MTTDEKYLTRCLELAKNGSGLVAPNPMVGAVIVYKDQIIGEGFHQMYGGPHAEVNAINSVKDKSLLSSSTLYINLEPCAHFGKTPPCCQLVIDSKFKRVVTGVTDPNPQVSGKGLEAIRAAGIEVTENVLQKECLELNRRFFTFHTKKRPYVILKWAQTTDGFIDEDRTPGQLGSFRITSDETQVLTHTWRREEAAILVGRRTIENDDPKLTCRLVEGKSPIRLIIDRELKLDYSKYNVGDGSVETYVITSVPGDAIGNVKRIIPANFSMRSVLKAIYALGIQSIIIEGGKATHTHFIEGGLWDEARVLTGNAEIGSGLRAPKLKGKIIEEFKSGVDRVQMMRYA